MDQTWENGKKPNFGLNFGSFGQTLGPKYFFLWVVPLSDVRHCCKLSYMQFQVKLMNQTWENDKKKPSFGHDFGLSNPGSDSQFFLVKNLALSVTTYYRQLSSCAISWNFVTDKRTDRQTEESDFIGRCPTNVERPKEQADHCRLYKKYWAISIKVKTNAMLNCKKTFFPDFTKISLNFT